MSADIVGFNYGAQRPQTSIGLNRQGLNPDADTAFTHLPSLIALKRVSNAATSHQISSHSRRGAEKFLLALSVARELVISSNTAQQS